MVKITIPIASLAILGLLLGACGLGPSTGQDGTTVEVQSQDLENVIDASGTLEVSEEVVLGFNTGGQVAHVFVSVGDEVSEDQALALLDTRDLSLQLEMAERSAASAASSVRVAATSYSDLAAGPTADQIAQAEVNVDKARDQRWGHQAQRDAICGRYEAGFAQQADCDQAEANVLAAEDGVRLAELELAELRRGASDASLANSREQVVQARNQQENATAEISQARLRLENATLYSPIAGTVTELGLRVGEQANGQTTLTVSDLSHLEVEVALDERDVADVAVGQAARVTVDAMEGEVFSGEVSAVAPKADTRSGIARFPVTIRVEATEPGLRAGMTARVEIITSVEHDVLAIPLKAITSRDGQNRVQLLERDAEGQPVTRGVNVTLGETVGDRVLVVDGLEEGDLVFIEAPAPETSGGFGPFGGGN
jgi:HlyD family secretion protein